MRAWSEVVSGRPDCRLVLDIDELCLTAALARLRSQPLDGLTFVPGQSGPDYFIDDGNAEQLAANVAASANGDDANVSNIYVCTTVQFEPGRVTFEHNYTRALAPEAEAQILAQLVAEPHAVRHWAFSTGGPDYGWEVVAQGAGGDELLKHIATTAAPL